MNSATTYTAFTSSSAATIRLGQIIGARLKSGSVIELKGDIGSGKTTLVGGIALGLGFTGDVSSPSFTLGRIYPLKAGLSLHHFDFYRLNGHDSVTNELNEVLQDSKAITVIEWPDQGEAHLPDRRLRITLKPAAEVDQRSIILESLNAGSEQLIEQVRHDNRD